MFEVLEINILGNLYLNMVKENDLTDLCGIRNKYVIYVFALLILTVLETRSIFCLR